MATYSHRARQAAFIVASGVVIGVGFLATTGSGYIAGPGLPVGCSTGERPEWDGSAWQCRTLNDYRSTHLEFSHDFLGLNATDWLSNGAAGTSASAAGAASTTARPGIADLTTGTTSTGSARWNGGSSTLLDLSSSFSSAMFEVVGGWPTLSTSSEEYTSIVGFGDTTTSPNQANGCFMLYDRGNVATGGPNSGNASKLSCWCCAASTCTKKLMDGSTVSDESFTTVDTPVSALTLPSTNINRMRVVITPGTRAEFYVDQGAGLTKRCDINTNLPTSRVTHVFNIVKSAGTTASHFYVDWAHLSLDLAAARSL